MEAMTAKRLYEAGSLADAKSAEGRWRIRIITEGKGSSATYPRSVLENYGSVFGSRPMFGNHPKDPSKPWERSPFEIKAKLAPEVHYEEHDGVAGLYADVIASPEVEKWLEEFHDVIGVSIFASGDGKEDENGDYVVESFDGSDPYTSVDFVVAPGRGGGVERVMEAYRALEQNGSAPAGTGTHEGEIRMDEATKAFFELLFKGLDDKFAAIEAKIDSATALVESVKDAQPERVEATEAAGELATAVAEAQFGEKAVKRVLESVKEGKSIAEAVQFEKDLRDEVLAENKSQRVVEGVFGGSADDDHDYSVSSVRFG